MVILMMLVIKAVLSGRNLAPMDTIYLEYTGPRRHVILEEHKLAQDVAARYA